MALRVQDFAQSSGSRGTQGGLGGLRRLNENFARELPLEYRQILKEYYETLAK